MPVSVTSTPSSTPAGSSRAATYARTRTSPTLVNLIALEIRLDSTWPSRVGSPTRRSGTSSSTATAEPTPAPPRTRPRIARGLVEDRRTSKSTSSSSSSPASILEKSRMSLMTPSRVRPAPWTPSARRRWSSSRPVRCSSSLRPITPFSGVRISWHIVARNSDLRREASIAGVTRGGELVGDQLALGHPAQLLGDLVAERVHHRVPLERRGRRDHHHDQRLALLGHHERHRRASAAAPASSKTVPPAASARSASRRSTVVGGAGSSGSAARARAAGSAPRSTTVNPTPRSQSSSAEQHAAGDLEQRLEQRLGLVGRRGHHLHERVEDDRVEQLELGLLDVADVLGRSRRSGWRCRRRRRSPGRCRGPTPPGRRGAGAARRR